MYETNLSVVLPGWQLLGFGTRCCSLLTSVWSAALLLPASELKLRDAAERAELWMKADLPVDDSERQEVEGGGEAGSAASSHNSHGQCLVKLNSSFLRKF